MIKAAVAVALLAFFWTWESWRPFFGQRDRLGHAGRNLALAIVNSVLLGLVFGSLFVVDARWTERESLGLLHQFDLPAAIRFGLALVLLDAWMYVWHRANHVVPLLWRFHRVHHSDRHMDVTTAGRFHVGELTGAFTMRLLLIPLLGLDVRELFVYDTLVLAMTQFHHADITLGRVDRWLRFVLVTPDMHKVHHSDRAIETDSNYSTVLSLWDRLAGTFRIRANPRSIVFGLTQFAEPVWQTWRGILLTPLAPVESSTDPASDHVPNAAAS
jgi:sterol desaturase/sphingolipid hydroxylase (fatty acid hydroxylase superfamily)